MKIKFLPLLLIFAGTIIIAGCVSTEAQPLSPKAPENLYRSIFYPYTGLLGHQGSDIPGPMVSEVHPPDPHEGPGCKPLHSLKDATFLLDRNIEKAEAISARLEEGIQHYKTEGKDVSKLETLLEKYDLLVKDAKKYRALADADVSEENNSSITNSDLENCSSENTRREYLIRSQKSMIQANIVLKEIFNEFQRLMPGRAELNSTSRLSATGDGIVALYGNFTLNLHLEEGDIAIAHLSPDFEINITGDYVFEKKAEMQDDMRLYHIHSADVNISGSRKTLQLRGSNITLTASDGEGSAVFLGNGTFRIEDKGGIIKEQKWANPPFPKEEANSNRYGPDKKDNNNTATGHRIGAIYLKKTSKSGGIGQEELYKRKSISFPEKI